jgi:hypothetical protein
MLANVRELTADWDDDYGSSLSSSPPGHSVPAVAGRFLGQLLQSTSERRSVSRTFQATGINSTYRTTPPTGLLAVAYSFFSMRPDR